MNHLLKTPGLIADIPWLAQPDPAVAAVVAANVWRFMPCTTIMLLAGLQGISTELFLLVLPLRVVSTSVRPISEMTETALGFRGLEAWEPAWRFGPGSGIGGAADPGQRGQIRVSGTYLLNWGTQRGLWLPEKRNGQQ